MTTDGNSPTSAHQTPGDLPASACCAIAGGGPAGMMLGVLLARAGVDVLVLEKHADFLRDFRGDTIHPSTLELMYELGWLDELLTLPHQKVTQVRGQIGDETLTVGDFTHLPTHAKFIAFMPQWDFLNFLARKGAHYPTFHLRLRAEVTGLVERDGRVAGLHVNTPTGPREVQAELIVGADGRGSIVRQSAGLEIEDLGAPMDVLWLRLPRRHDDPYTPLGRFDRGRVFVLLNRDDYWQCGYVIAKGTAATLRAAGLAAFRASIAQLVPWMADRVDTLTSWDDVHLLTVRVDRLKTWHRPGLLCIGDSAHAMSPVGGVGINLAIQDAVAAANLLYEPLLAGRVTDEDLQRVQQRREWPTRVTQRVQLFIQDRAISGALSSAGPLTPPWPVRLLGRFPYLRRFPARLMGMGARPEHIHTPDAFAGT
ncbi:MAG: FAD-dependent oxidoreductase [Pirellulales bacterium]|nr:FAD-dependent oxidoreductase [Pirellulales bacterium]